MPTYHYRCDRPECAHEFTTFHSIKADFLTECPECAKNSLHTVIYNPLLIAFGDPRTVGALAEHNTAKLGTYEREAMWAAQDEHKELIKKTAREELYKKLPTGASLPEEKPREKPWFGEPTKDLTTLTPKETQRYIFEGK